MTGNGQGFKTKERILSIAAQLFAENGYHATGISELSEAVQLGRGALYYHMGSKENLLYEISRVPVERLVRDARLVVNSMESPQWKLRVLARELMSNIATSRPEWTVFFRELNALSGDGRSEILSLREGYEALWRKVLSDGAEAGLFKSVDPILVKGILGMFNYSYLWLDPGGTSSPEDVADLFAQALLNGIATHSNPDQPRALIPSRRTGTSTPQ